MYFPIYKSDLSCKTKAFELGDKLSHGKIETVIVIDKDGKFRKYEVSSIKAQGEAEGFQVIVFPFDAPEPIISKVMPVGDNIGALVLKSISNDLSPRLAKLASSKAKPSQKGL